MYNPCVWVSKWLKVPLSSMLRNQTSAPSGCAARLDDGDTDVERSGFKKKFNKRGEEPVTTIIEGPDDKE